MRKTIFAIVLGFAALGAVATASTAVLAAPILPFAMCPHMRKKSATSAKRWAAGGAPTITAAMDTIRIHTTMTVLATIDDRMATMAIQVTGVDIEVGIEVGIAVGKMTRTEVSPSLIYNL